MRRQSSTILKIFSALLLPCLLSGCAKDYLTTGLPMLEGKPIAQAVYYLGYPTEEKKILNKTMYSWINHQSGSFFVPDSVLYPAVSNAYGSPVMVFSRPVYPPREEFYNWSCRLDIVTDNDIIVYTQYRGNGGACQIFNDQIKPLATTAAAAKPPIAIPPAKKKDATE
jgi:hypothetical protein